MRAVLAHAVALILLLPGLGAHAAPFELTQLITADLERDDRMGSAASLDGTTAALGAPGNGGHAQVLVFEQGDHPWTWDRTAVVEPRDDQGTTYFGWDVAVDGDTLAITHLNRMVIFYERVGGAWVFQAELEPSDAVPSDQNYGIDLALEGDLAAVGSHYKGQVYLYERAGGAWAEAAILTAPDGESWFGEDVDLDDGRLLVTSGDDLHLFERAGDGWEQTFTAASDGAAGVLDGDLLVHGDGQWAWDGSAWQATSLGLPPITADARALLQGDLFVTDGRVFQHDGSAWAERTDLDILDALDSELVPSTHAVAASGNRLLFGFPMAKACSGSDCDRAGVALLATFDPAGGEAPCEVDLHCEDDDRCTEDTCVDGACTTETLIVCTFDQEAEEPPTDRPAVDPADAPPGPATADTPAPDAAATEEAGGGCATLPAPAPGLAVVLAILAGWARRRRSALVLAAPLLLLGCGPGGDVAAAPAVEILAEGTGETNEQPLWVPRVGDRANHYVIDGSTERGGETVYRLHLDQVDWLDTWLLAERAEGVVVVGTGAAPSFDRALLWLPAEVREGMRWQSTIRPDEVYELEVLSRTVQSTEFGERPVWHIELQGPDGGTASHQFVEGYGLMGSGMTQFFQERAPGRAVPRVPTEHLEDYLPDWDVLAWATGGVRPAGAGHTLVQFRSLVTFPGELPTGVENVGCLTFDGEAVTIDDAGGCLPEGSPPSLADVVGGEIHVAGSGDELDMAAVPDGDQAPDLLHWSTFVHHKGQRHLVVADDDYTVLRRMGHHAWIDRHGRGLFSGRLLPLTVDGWHAERLEGDGLLIAGLNERGEVVWGVDRQADDQPLRLSRGAGVAGRLTVAVDDDGRSWHAASPDGLVQRIEPTPSGPVVTPVAHFELPPGQTLLTALPHERDGGTDWLLIARSPGESFYSYGLVHLHRARTEGPPEPARLDHLPTGVTAAAAGADMVVCWPPELGDLAPDSQWWLGGAPARWVGMLEPGSGCALVVRDLDRAVVDDQRADAGWVEGEVPELGHVALGGEDLPILPHRATWWNHVGALYDYPGGAVALAGGGFRSARRLFGQGAIARALAPVGAYVDWLSFEDPTEYFDPSSVGVPGAVWMFEEGGLWRLTADSELVLTDAEMAEFGGGGFGMMPAPDGGVVLASADVWRHVSQDGAITAYDAPSEAWPESYVSWGYIGPEGTACGTDNQRRMVCQDPDGELRWVWLPGMLEGVSGRAYLPDGRWLLSSTSTQGLYLPGQRLGGTWVFDPATMSFELLEIRPLVSVAYAPDGSLWGVANHDRTAVWRWLVRITADGFEDVDLPNLAEATLWSSEITWNQVQINSVLPGEDLLFLGYHRRGNYESEAFVRVPRPDGRSAPAR